MSETSSNLQPARPLFGTSRRDAWWIAPLLIWVGLFLFIVYSTWAAFEGANYQWGPYLSPFYSPLFEVDWWPASPAFLILWIPAGFRLTCYYYRKAYYRAYPVTPPACAVGGIRHNYHGERALFLFQNFHRYFLYLALALVVILAHDAWVSFQFQDGWGIGIGSLVLTLNAIFLAAFTFGCNSLRHLVGGNVNCYSCVKFGKERFKLWRIVTRFNEYHQQWAWISLYWVGFADVYIRLVSMGVITDLRII